MGGMGKTTLAEVAYKMYSKEFEVSCFIDNVREKSEKKRLPIIAEKSYFSNIK